MIAQRLGYVSVRIVLDVYGQLYEGLDEQAADALDGLVSDWDVRYLFGSGAPPVSHSDPQNAETPADQGLPSWALLGSNQ